MEFTVEEMENKKGNKVIIDREEVKGGMKMEKIMMIWGVRLIRLFCSFLCLAALLVMIFSKQTIVIFGFTIKARYNYSNAFMFLAGVDGTVCGCSLISLIYVFLLSHSKPHPNSCFKLFVHDLVMLLLMVAGCAAATSIAYIGKYGQSQTGWAPICIQVKQFCFKTTISLVLSYIALICYLFLTVLSVLQIKKSSMGSNKVDMPTQAPTPIANY